MSLLFTLGYHGSPMLPPAIAKLADTLARMPGAVAVVLGGSRALGTASEQSDWDLGVAPCHPNG